MNNGEIKNREGPAQRCSYHVFSDKVFRMCHELEYACARGKHLVALELLADAERESLLKGRELRGVGEEVVKRWARKGVGRERMQRREGTKDHKTGVQNGEIDLRQDCNHNTRWRIFEGRRAGGGEEWRE